MVKETHTKGGYLFALLNYIGNIENLQIILFKIIIV